MSKYIFVTGGVCSGLGKGVASASIASLLENRGINIRMIKIDPYINVDAGTMNPYQHGEVYVTDDGAETDLDLGNYSRFTSAPIGKDNSITTGQVYQAVITKEREGRFLGKTVQVIPHITDEIKARIARVGEQPGVDVTIIEVGGTVGDIESVPFLEAARQFMHELGKENVISIHLTLVPQVYMGEPKSKPTQHSVRELREIGIQPDILLCRSSIPLDDDMRRKIALFTNVEKEAVISGYDVRTTIYDIPNVYLSQKVDVLIIKKLGLGWKVPALEKAGPEAATHKGWLQVVDRFTNSRKTVRVAIVGKYTGLHDAYISIFESLFHGGLDNLARVQLVKFESEELEDGRELAAAFSDCDGILVPGGFGLRGIEGMVLSARHARERKVPYLGICLGMQIMVIEYARAKLGLKDANSTEFVPDAKNPVVSLLEEQVDIKAYGGTMRLGRSETRLAPGTRIFAAYGTETVSERHRHRYEVSNQYRKGLQEAGLIIGGLTPDSSLVESVEWPDHPWGVGVQFHPEFKSKPLAPSPLFSHFIRACLEAQTQKETRRSVSIPQGAPGTARRPILRATVLVPCALFALLLSGCSINYDTTEEEALSEEIPNTVALDVVHKVNKGGRLSIQLEASRAETFDKQKKTILTDAHFIEYDDTGETATEGSGGRVVFHTDTEDAEISSSVHVHSTTEKGDVSAKSLSWEHTSKILTAGPGERVVMSKDDGTSLSGLGFTGDFRRRQITFSGAVEGTYVWEKKNDNER